MLILLFESLFLCLSQKNFFLEMCKIQSLLSQVLKNKITILLKHGTSKKITRGTNLEDKICIEIHTDIQTEN